MNVTDKMVEAAMAAYAEKYQPADWTSTVRAAIAAALSAMEGEAGTPSPVDRSGGIVEAARDVISSASDTYKKRNGHLASFEDASGEKCWIVPFDAFEGLRAALAASEGSTDG